MIILGVILLIVGLVAGISMLVTIGIIVAIAGAVLFLLGRTGHAVGGRAPVTGLGHLDSVTWTRSLPPAGPLNPYTTVANGHHGHRFQRLSPLQSTPRLPVWTSTSSAGS